MPTQTREHSSMCFWDTQSLGRPTAKFTNTPAGSPKLSIWTGSPTPVYRVVRQTTPSPDLLRGASRPSELSSAAQLRELTGFTATQIGRIFGVSRRAVQGWIAGATMARHHEEKMARVLGQVRQIAGPEEQRRAAILRSDRGPSIFAQWAEEGRDGRIIQPSALSGADLLKS